MSTAAIDWRKTSERKTGKMNSDETVYQIKSAALGKARERSGASGRTLGRCLMVPGARQSEVNRAAVHFAFVCARV